MSTRDFPAEGNSRITIARAEVLAEPSRLLIEALNAELTGAYPEPGATHFGLTPEDVAPGRGAFLIIYDAGTPVGCACSDGVIDWARMVRILHNGGWQGVLSVQCASAAQAEVSLAALSELVAN